jgi:hypothetical protein
MSFELFDFKPDIEIMGTPRMNNSERFIEMKKYLPQNSFPKYIQQYILTDASTENDVCFHKPSPFGTDRSSSYTSEEIEKIRRTKGIFSTNEFSRGDKPDARHHLKIFYNTQGKARLFYKINGKSIKFIQNKKND